MSGGVQGAGHGGGQPVPNILYSDPPNPAYGHDLFIQQLLAQNGMDPGDSFKPASPNEGEHGGGHGGEQGSRLNTVIKWSGIVFAGIMGLLGLRKFGPKILGALKK